MKIGTHLPSRTHDHYYVCDSPRFVVCEEEEDVDGVELPEGHMEEAPCWFWAYDAVKAARHARRHKHNVKEVMLEYGQRPPSRFEPPR